MGATARMVLETNGPQREIHALLKDGVRGTEALFFFYWVGKDIPRGVNWALYKGGKMDEYFHNHYTLDTVRISSYPCRIDCFSVLGTKTQICVGRDAILPLRLRWLLVRRQCAKYRYLWWRRSCKKLAQTCADQPQKAIPARATRPFSETLKETRGRSSMRSGSGREGKLSFLRIAGSALQFCNRDRYCSKTASAARHGPYRAASSLVTLLRGRYLFRLRDFIYL